MAQLELWKSISVWKYKILMLVKLKIHVFLFNNSSQTSLEIGFRKKGLLKCEAQDCF